MSNAISRRDFLKVTGAVGAAGLLAACGGGSSSSTAAANSAPASVAAPTGDAVELSISWWGGESRHEAYQAAIAAFSEANSNITVNPTFAAWSGWEDTMSTKFAGGVAEDVCQVNWNWLYNYSGNGQTFIDLNSVSDYIDLSQWDESVLNTCVVADMLQAIPVQLGDDYYPLHLGGYDRMIMMVFYLESIYGKDWADPATSTLNYTAEEIAEGLDFIKSLVDNHVVMPLPTYYGNNGSTAAHQSNEWITGKIAGILEWDSSASKYQDALDEDNKAGFTVGEEIKFGDYNGGFTKVSMGLAITQTCEHPAEAAMLVDYLLNSEEGAAIMGSECGIPASKAGLAAAEAAGAVDELVNEANSKVMAFCAFQLDPLFEHNNLKADGTGIYQEVFDTIDYDGVSGAEVVDILLDGMESVGYTINA